MRNDLPSMTTGRAMAQASHASNAFLHESPNTRGVATWKNETKQGFGTAIVLSADMPSIHEILEKVKGMKADGIYANKVIDPEYGVKTTTELYYLMCNNKSIQESKTIFDFENESVVFFRSEVTCAYVFGSKAVLKPILGDYPLHP